jgi:hypothetical protein
MVDITIIEGIRQEARAKMARLVLFVTTFS